MSYPKLFIRCRLRAVHPFDGVADEIGLQLDRLDEGEPLRLTLCRTGALRLADQLRAYLADTPAEDNEIDAVVSALAALTDRVRALEERAVLAAPSPFSFADDGKLYVSPVVIPTVSTVEQAIADEAHERAESAAKLYNEVTRATAEPADGLLARIDALETAVTSLQTSVSALSSAVSHISAFEGGVDCKLAALEGQLDILQDVVNGLEAITNERRGRPS